ncbi:MAG: L,D-transpeptidase [Candidatus Paceibacterota bacterium]
MTDDDSSQRRFYAVSYKDDIPKPGKGALIPYDKQKTALAVRRIDKYAGLILVPLAALLFLFTASLVGVKVTAGISTASLPMVSVVNPFTEEVKPLNYGVQVALTQPSFFAETIEAFVEEKVTFIEADLTTMQLRYFVDGVLVENIPIEAKGKEGSWWQTPAGLYKIEFKRRTTIRLSVTSINHGVWPSRVTSSSTAGLSILMVHQYQKVSLVVVFALVLKMPNDYIT